MKHILLGLVMVFCLVPSLHAQTSLFQDATEVRASAVLTTSDALSTTFTIPADAKAVHYYVDFTKGSLTSATFAPAGAMDGNPAGSGYYKSAGVAQILENTGKYHIRVPREEFGSYRYGGIFASGSGTATGSLAGIKIKFEY